MKKRKKDTSFSPVILEGAQAEWFADYLEGKVKIDTETDRIRRQMLKEAAELEFTDRIWIKMKS